MAIASKLAATFPVPSFGLYIEGTDFNDTLFGTALADEIHGRSGADVLHGGDGDDFLLGEAGNDSLLGGAGNDRLEGGTGNDVLVGGSGADQLIGGDGFDTASYASSGDAVYVNLANNYGALGDAQGDTFSGIDKVIGSHYDDGLIADDSGVVLDGGAGNDYLRGGAGLDVLIGGAGNDELVGGRGLDILTGGSGSDLFVFFFRDDGPDLITDFEQGVDVIFLGPELSSYIGPFGRDGELLTGTSVPVHTSNIHLRDTVFYDTDDHQLYHLSYRPSQTQNGLDITATLLVTFEDDVQLTASDFLL